MGNNEEWVIPSKLISNHFQVNRKNTIVSLKVFLKPKYYSKNNKKIIQILQQQKFSFKILHLYHLLNFFLGCVLVHHTFNNYQIICEVML